MRKKCKTTVKLLRPDQVWHPRLGAPLRNRNAAKPIPPLSALRLQIRALKRRARVLLATASA